MTTLLRQERMLIGGQLVQADGDRWLKSINPYTTDPWARIPRGTASDVDRAMTAADSAFTDPAWRDLTATDRGTLLVRLADLIAERAEDLARIESTDNGKLLAETRAQVNYLPGWFRFFGGLADKTSGRVIPIDRADSLCYTRREPLGVIAAITPWNSSLLLATWKLAPALAAGNTVVWKPSEHASVSALELAPLFEEAGFPPGVVNIVTGLGDEVGAPLVSHPRVAKIAVTGGDATGQRIYEQAARAIRPVTLELGGKSANIVFADADLDAAVNGLISGIFAASGQTCIAGSRALVQRSVHDEVVERLLVLARTAKLGDPLAADTRIGPITTLDQHAKVLEYIAIGQDEGAQLRLGGGAPAWDDRPAGWFVEPTIFTGVLPTMRIAQEEIFGPVLSVIAFDDEDEAVAIANGTEYGLAAGVWTSNLRRAVTLPPRLQAGTVWVNTYRAVSFLAPFGGYKRSGLGRESGEEAINEYLQTKTVWIDVAGDVANPFVIR